MLFLPFTVTWRKCIFFLIHILISLSVSGQNTPGYYRLQLSDKEGGSFTVTHPEAYLSQKAILRRITYNIPVTEADLPVSSKYLDSLSSLGLEIYSCSKWFNSVTVRTSDTILLDTLSSIDFIRTIEKTRPLSTKKSTQVKWDELKTFEGTSEIQEHPLPQLSLNNGDQLHDLGFRGKGITIAVLDAGFYHVDTLPAFDSLRSNGQILGTWDFVAGNDMVYDDHTHGMNVLSILGGLIPGGLTGSSPEADFWLLRSEDANSEYIIEEDLWTAAAEFADSAGADIISSSLGYYLFNDTTQNHRYQDMNGKTTRVTQAAVMAARRGLLVVNSAGNEGLDPWHYIIAPADADSILAVGAVDSLNIKAPFSSFGPTSDDRIKPDVTAMGVYDLMQGADGTLVHGNGTSFSAPIISGLVACLWQAFPDASAQEIIRAVKQSGDHSNQPDNMTGYGSPDFLTAFSQMNAIWKVTPASPLLIFPNPFYDHLLISFDTAQHKSLVLRFFDLSGHLLLLREVAPPTGGVDFFVIDRLDTLPNGLLMLKITSGTEVHCKKVFKYGSY